MPDGHMIGFVGGALAAVLAVMLIWHFRAQDGQLHRLVQRPGMETTIALAAVALFSAGIAMMTSAFLG